MLDRRRGGVERRVAGEDDDRDVVVEPADLPEEIDARDARHHEIHDADVELALAHDLHGLGRVVDRANREAVPGEELV